MRVYLSVPMVANRERERARIMAKAIVDSGNELTSPWVLDSYERHDPARLNVFVRDKKGAEESDVVVADVSQPSIGVGMEVMAAYYKKRRILAVVKRGSQLSGMIAHMDGKETVEFDSDEELYSSLKRALGPG